MTAAVKMDAGRVVDALATRHAGDVWIVECKDGESWGRNHRRLDAWAMKRSWSPWRTIGYEVKVSRADFLQDQKWTGYRDVCHELFLACPAGLVRAHELPDWAGLIWISRTGRAWTKRKAERHDPDPVAIPTGASATTAGWIATRQSRSRPTRSRLTLSRRSRQRRCRGERGEECEGADL